MRYLLAIALAFLLVGNAFADGIPVGTDPKNFPTVWTQTVYNGSGDDIQSAQVVRWDIAASTGDYIDMCNWVEECDSIADIRTAGVTIYGQTIENGNVGEIIVKGPAFVYCAANTTTENTGVEATATGEAVDETLAASDEALLGWVIEDSPYSTSGYTFLADTYAIIYVQPTPYSGD